MSTVNATIWKCDRCGAVAPAFDYIWSFLDWMKAPKAMAEALAEMVKGGLLP